MHARLMAQANLGDTAKQRWSPHGPSFCLTYPRIVDNPERTLQIGTQMLKLSRNSIAPRLITLVSYYLPAESAHDHNTQRTVAEPVTHSIYLSTRFASFPKIFSKLHNYLKVVSTYIDPMLRFLVCDFGCSLLGGDHLSEKSQRDRS